MVWLVPCLNNDKNKETIKKKIQPRNNATNLKKKNIFHSNLVNLQRRSGSIRCPISTIASCTIFFHPRNQKQREVVGHDPVHFFVSKSTMSKVLYIFIRFLLKNAICSCSALNIDPKNTCHLLHSENHDGEYWHQDVVVFAAFGSFRSPCHCRVELNLNWKKKSKEKKNVQWNMEHDLISNETSTNQI